VTPRKKNQAAFKRRQTYIKKDFQTRFIVKFVLILVAGGLLSVGLTFLNTQDSLTAVYANSRLTIQNTSLAIMPSVVFTTLITTLALGVVVIVVTLLVSHKIAGPMFRFEKDINRIAQGDLESRIHIRKGDQFQEMAMALNRMVESIAGRLKTVRDMADDKMRHCIDEKFKL
jgi:methyl-accepting chemotaxis protein